jgi:hypothetical protein
MGDLQGFISQPLVPGLLAMACIPGLLFISYVVYAYMRATRRISDNTKVQATTPEASNVNGLDALKNARQQAQYDPSDLPDLDLLMPQRPVSVPSSPAQLPKNNLRVIADNPQKLRLQGGSVTQALELLTVLRDERDGRLLVQIGDKGYRSLADAPEAKREFTKIMKELSGLIMQPDDNPPSEIVAPEPEFLSPEPPSKSMGELLSQTPPAMPAKSAMDKPQRPRPKVDRDVALPGDLPSYKFDDNPAKIQFGRGGVKKVDFTPPPAMDIASAIEAYLQYRLRDSELEGRDIHVLPSIGGGVRIKVDQKFYEFVDEIEEHDVQAFVKNAIAEWQERQV